MEQWIDIPGWENYYQVSNFGNVRSLDRIVQQNGKCDKTLVGRERLPFIGTSGYYVIKLKRNNKGKNFMIHRLVAICFIENPNNYDQVNHKDNNKLNNCVENLEWCNQFQNVQHAFANKFHSGKGATHYKAKKITCTKTGVEYATLQEAADAIGMKKVTLHAKLIGRNSNNTTLVYL